jgi:hypothetical protein
VGRGRRSLVAFAFAVAALWAAVIAFAGRERCHGDVRALLYLGRSASHPSVLNAVPRLSEHGYDGQYYATLATDPLLRDPATARMLDRPSYRARRVAIPALAHALALGDPAHAVVTYQLLCWTGGLAAVVIVAAWLRSRGGGMWMAAPLAVSIGLTTSMLRSTPDAAALALALAAIWLHERGRARGSLALAIAATLARETLILAPLAIAAALLRQRRWRAGVAFVALPALALAIWTGYLWSALGGGFVLGTGALSLPFAALVDKLAATLSDGYWVFSRERWAMASVIAAMVAAPLVLLRKPADACAGLLAVTALMVPFLSAKVLVEAYAYGRVLIAAPFVATLVAPKVEGRAVRWLLHGVSLTAALAGLVMLALELPLPIPGLP